MKVKVVLEMEVSNFSRHLIDGMLTEYLERENIESVRTVGAYTDENDNPISDDFFIVDDNFSCVTEAVLMQEGIPAEAIKEFIESEALFDLHQEWSEYIQESADANMHGKEKFAELAQKYIDLRAA